MILVVYSLNAVTRINAWLLTQHYTALHQFSKLALDYLKFNALLTDLVKPVYLIVQVQKSVLQATICVLMELVFQASGNKASARLYQHA